MMAATLPVMGMAAPDLSVDEIVDRIQRDGNDNLAFSALVTRFEGDLARAVARIPALYRPEVKQNAWGRVMLVLRRYDPGRGSLGAIVNGCAHLAVSDFWRQYYRQPRTESAAPSSASGQLDDDMPGSIDR